MINLAHVHVAISHFPVVILPIGTVFLGVGLLRQNLTLRHSGNVLIALGAIYVGIVYFLGGYAESFAQASFVVPHGSIHRHEEAAELALIVSSMAGLCAILALFRFSWEFKYANQLVVFILILGSIACGLVGRTAYFGGKIRHTEFTHSIEKSVHYEE